MTDEVEPGWKDERDPVAAPHSLRSENGRDGAGILEQFAEGEGRTIHRERQPVAIGPRAVHQNVTKRAPGGAGGLSYNSRTLQEETRA